MEPEKVASHDDVLIDLERRVKALEAIVIPATSPPPDSLMTVYHKRHDGAVEEHKMAPIDAEEAIGSHPDHWLREHPHGAKVVAPDPAPVEFPQPLPIGPQPEIHHEHTKLHKGR
jgi:hypothetical protein